MYVFEKGSVVNFEPASQDPVPHLDMQAGRVRLVQNKSYLVQSVDQGRFESYLYLTEFPGQPFNTKLFKTSNVHHTETDLAEMQSEAAQLPSPEKVITAAEQEAKIIEKAAIDWIRVAEKLDTTGELKVRIELEVSKALGFRLATVPVSIKAGLLKKERVLLDKTSIELQTLKFEDNAASIVSRRKATGEEVALWNVFVQAQYLTMIQNLYQNLKA